jgi:asparagine synthetase B (glutamine-hydrolysing)
MRLLVRNLKVLERLGLVCWKHKWCRLLDRLLLAPGLHYAVSLGQVPLAVILTWLTPSLGSSLLEDLEMLNALWDDCQHNDNLHRMLYCDHHFLLPDGLLFKADRASMAVGLEIRPALLDSELLSWAMTIPPALKVRGIRTKYLLRKAYKRVLPNDILKAPKMGFHLRRLSHWVRMCIPDMIARLREIREWRCYLDVKAIEKSISDFLQGCDELGQALWNLYNLLLWHSRWMPERAPTANNLTQ